MEPEQNRSGHITRHRPNRSSVIGAMSRPRSVRMEEFTEQLASTCESLKERWPIELGPVLVRLSNMPTGRLDGSHDPRWTVVRSEPSVTFHRLPMQRSWRMRGADAVARRTAIEYCVVTAFAEYMRVEPWEISWLGSRGGRGTEF